MRLLKVTVPTVLALGVSVTGCVTNGDNFRSDTSWVKENQTKQADVRMLLGEPYSVGNAGGKPTWTYGFYRYKLFGKSFQKELKLYWNPDGTVDNYSFNSSFPDDTKKGEGAKSSSPAHKDAPEY